MAAKRPTILQIIPELDTGGAELSAVEIASAVAKGGGRALVLSEGGRLASRIDAAGGEFVPFSAATKNPIHMLWNAFRIRHIVAQEGVDLIHARSRAPAWSALLAARMSGTPFVTTYHGAYGERGRLKRLYNSVMARGDIVIANSRYTANLITLRYGTPAERIRVIYRGVDGTDFDPEAIASLRIDALRRQWGVAAGEPVILQAARLTGWKGQSVLIAAASRLASEGRLGRGVVILAGDAQRRDDYRQRLGQQITEAGLGDRVRLVGHVDDMAAAFALARVAVVASTEPEAFGRAATESQVMGCPVVATAIGAPPETVRTGDTGPDGEATGWLVPPGDAERLAGVLAEALAMSGSDRLAMGRRARSHVLSTFPLEAMRRQTLAVYDTLLKTHLERQFVDGPAADPH